MSEKVSFDRVSNPPKQGRSCWIYGCVSLVIIGAIGVAMIIGFGVWAKNQIVSVTSETSVKLPVTEYSAEQMEALEVRLAEFNQAATNQEPAVNLVLSSEEINALLKKHASLPTGEVPVYLEMEGKEVTAQISLPLDAVAEAVPLLGALKGRFLNGTGTLRVIVQDGYVAAFLQDLEVNGKQVPEQMMSQIRNQNIFKDAQNDPKMRKMIENFERVEIKDGKLIVIPKSSGAGVPDEKADETSR